MFACGSVLLTVGLVFIRGRARLIPPVRASWSIVRKELTACDDVLELFTETLTLWSDTWLPASITPTPILFTASECNYFRLRRELRALRESCEESESVVVDDSKLTSHKATLQLPAYERKVVRRGAPALFRGGGEVRHISGEINPADPYSRGLPVRCPFEEDEALKIAIDVKNRDPTGEVLCAVPGEEAAVEEDDELIYEPDPQLVDSIRDSQKDDVFLKRLLDGDYACDRERRLYIVVDAKKCPDYANGVSTLRALQSTFYESGYLLTPPRCERAHGWYETLHKTFLQIVRALLLGDQSRTLKWFDVVDRAAWTINHVYRHSDDSDIFPAELHFCYGRALPPNYDDRVMTPEAAKFVSTMTKN
ncbi:hypothetical protein FOZ61_008862 [Perkinsus olseni]|uniref:Uncharacterized protein n=1 Tax=Perkinsus olseni TaxID=32597 RepID=A0A7J6L1Z7_PEROL|nr:hypothetical protein FOZ61_008862 [Perkinsus olseni]